MKILLSLISFCAIRSAFANAGIGIKSSMNWNEVKLQLLKQMRFCGRGFDSSFPHFEMYFFANFIQHINGLIWHLISQLSGNIFFQSIYFSKNVSNYYFYLYA